MTSLDPLAVAHGTPFMSALTPWDPPLPLGFPRGPPSIPPKSDDVIYEQPFITDDWMTHTSRYRADARVSKNPGKSSGWSLSFSHLSTWFSCLHFVRSNAGFPVWRSRARMTKPLGTVSKSPATTSSSPTTARTHAANSNVSGKVTYFLSINCKSCHLWKWRDRQWHWQRLSSWIAFAIPRNMFIFGKA